MPMRMEDEDKDEGAISEYCFALVTEPSAPMTN